MREPVGECHPLAVIACSRNRLERTQADMTVRPCSSPRATTKLMINQVQTQKNALMVEVTGKPVAVTSTEPVRQ